MTYALVEAGRIRDTFRHRTISTNHLYLGGHNLKTVIDLEHFVQEISKKMPKENNSKDNKSKETKVMIRFENVESS